MPMPKYGPKIWHFYFSPECSYIQKFEFGPKMTELWAKNACSYMGARTIFDYNSALK